MARRTLPILSDQQSKQVLRELCKKHNLSVVLVTELIEIQRSNLGRGKQIGISQEFNAAIAEFLDNGGAS
jgi:hypothetical protein